MPAIAPDTPALARMPVIMYLSDDFQRPYPFSPSVVVDVEPVLESIVDMLACHRSQFFDWLPYNRGELDQVPSDPKQQRPWLRAWILGMVAPLADRYREQIISTYGEDLGRKIRYIEAFETCEYGAALTPRARRKLLPFLPDEGPS